MRIGSNRSAISSRLGNGKVSSLLAIFGALAGGCMGDVTDTELEDRVGQEQDVEVSSASQALGTINGTDTNNHLASKSSETAITVSITSNGSFSLITARNSWSDPLITFNNNSRQVRRGASLMAFTTSDYSGNVLTSQRMAVPAGMGALWGDPATTTSKTNGQRVFITSLAVPNSKFPASGLIEGSAQTNQAGFCGAFVGAACFARSNDGGLSFSNFGCIQRTDDPNCPAGTFYDGADMESTPDGRIWAAYNDVARGRTDVYVSDGVTSFTRIPNQLTVASNNHPRLRSGPGGLYVLVASGGTLRLNRLNGVGVWEAPVTVDTGITSSDVNLAGVAIRLGPQYDLAIGPNETGQTEARVAYTVQGTDGRKHIRVARCTTGTPITCTPNVWRTDSTAGNQWGPAIATGPGNITGDNTWLITYYSSQNFTTQSAAELWRMRVIRSSTGLLTTSTTRQESGQFVCPDNRGYWGDYDDMVYGGFGQFFRPFTDSSHAACVRAQFTSTPQWVALSGYYKD